MLPIFGDALIAPLVQYALRVRSGWISWSVRQAGRNPAQPGLLQLDGLLRISLLARGAVTSMCLASRCRLVRLPTGDGGYRLGEMAMKYPADFQFGVATAAAQIEGGAYEDGRGESIWDAFARQPGKIRNGDTPTVACDSYHRFDTDLDNLKALGVNAYRMSIAWPRVMPQGTGQLNDKGMDYYRRAFEKLLAAGISPNVTLYHWDLPQALEDKGGWLNRDSVLWFSEYADKMFSAFGDIIPYWVTINEPIAVYVGYGLGFFAPGYKDIAKGNQARHNVLTAHAPRWKPSAHPAPGVESALSSISGSGIRPRIRPKMPPW